MAHIVVPLMALQSPSAPWVLSLAPPLGTLFLEDVATSGGGLLLEEEVG